MLGTLLAFAAAAPTVIDAERAFAQMAQDKGQWTAFRAYAAPDAVMFTPQPVNAQDFLKDRKDPPKAIRWQPTHAWMSCDGTLAVDTGNWQSADGKTVGFFTTVWQRQADGGWKWIYDGGDELKVARAFLEKPRVVTAACTSDPDKVLKHLYKSSWPNRPQGEGMSPDHTLMWNWMIDPLGSRGLSVEQWDGKTVRTVLYDAVLDKAKLAEIRRAHEAQQAKK